MKFTYALRFKFDTSNNEAEYEALVAGLRIAKQREGGYSWMTSLLEYLTDDMLPAETKKARAIKIKSRQYAVIGGVMYREGIKARLDEGSKNWIEEVPHVLCAHRTMIKTSNGDTPFSLTYGTEAIISIEIGMPSLRCTEVDQILNDEALLLNLDILEEKRERAAIREAKSKAKTEKYYNTKVRNTPFKPGDFMYQSNEASHA
ncbi:reverse transcriptase domain-containing protein [Tanacetum coccineum]